MVALGTLTPASHVPRTYLASVCAQAHKQAPEIVSLYALNISPSMIRLKIRQDFERNRHISDLSIINMLHLKNQQEFQETMNCWKQEVSLVLSSDRRWMLNDSHI